MVRKNSTKSFVIGIIGGMAAGKSTASNLLGNMASGIIINTDDLAHDCYPEVFDKLVERWPSLGDMQIDEDSMQIRLRLRKLATKKSDLLFLEKLIVPLVKIKISKIIEVNSDRVIIIESPLLHECGLDKICDEIWYVDMPRDLRLANFVARSIKHHHAASTIWLAETFKVREGKMKLADKKRKANRIICNFYDMEHLESALNLAWKDVKEKYKLNE